mgnify:CR=1 FL=1
MVDSGYNKWLKENARKSPCYDCEERKPKCHGSCEKYIAFRTKRDEELHSTRKRNEWAVTKRTDKIYKKKREGRTIEY